MKLRKPVSLILGAALALVLAFCTCATATAEQSAWTILIYLCGTDLESDDGFASKNMQAMLKSEDNESINLVIECGGTKTWQNGIRSDVLSRYVRKGDELKWTENAPDADMGNADTLEEFISWGIGNYPAERVGLIIWDHGSSSVGGVCFDDLHDRHSLSLKDIGSVLEKTSKKLPGGFEFIGYDACLMASLENANIIAPYAHYMYASEESEPGTGWDYQTLLTWLAENPQADGLQLGKEVCESYGTWQANESSWTFSIIDLSKVGAVTEAFEAAAKEMNAAGADAEIVRAILKAEAFGSNNRLMGFTNMVDIKDMLERVSAYAPSASKAVETLSSAVVMNATGAEHPRAGGLSIYYPIRLSGTMELPDFAEICPSASYLAFVNRVADTASIQSASSSPFGTWASVGDSTAFTLTNAAIDSHGTFTVTLDSMDQFARATCVAFYETENGTRVYLGERENVAVDYENHTVNDKFDGKWLALNGSILPVELVSQNDSVSVYMTPIVMAGKEMSLRILYDREKDVFTLDGVCQDIDAETGMSHRTVNLENGDVFMVCYYDIRDGKKHVHYSSPIRIGSEISFDMITIPEGYYKYSFILYDLAGNNYVVPAVTFRMDEDGTLRIPWDKNPGYAN